MKKRALCFGIILLLLLPSLFVYAGNSSYHNDKMRRILFSSGRCLSSQQQEADNNIKMLEYASYLTLDQSGNKNGDQEKLAFLNQQGVKKIVKTIQEINPEVDFMHRSFTHRGWNYSYIRDKSNWNARKEILLNTAEKIFSFEKVYSTTEATRKREAFCKIIYYVHILGDWYYDDCDNLQINLSADDSEEIEEKERGLIIAFAQAHPGQSNPDIFWELEDAAKTLFSDQSNSIKYFSFTSKLKALASEARALEGLTGGVNTKERYQLRNDYEKELMELLEAYIPLLLDDTAFFRNAFPFE